MKRQPTMAELMVGTPSSSGTRDEGIEKAAAQAQVGEIFEGLTKEAKEDLIGTMGWAGRVFGEQLAEALRPEIQKLASIVSEIKVARETLQKNMPLTEEYEAGSPAPASNIGGLPTDPRSTRPGVMDARKSNAPGATRDNVDKSQGGKGWPQTQSTESGLLQARRIQEVSKISSILSRTQGQPQQPQGPVKEASLADIGKAFKEQLKADLAQGE